MGKRALKVRARMRASVSTALARRRPIRSAASGLVAPLVALLFAVTASVAAGAPSQGASAAAIRVAQVIEEERTGMAAPVGLAYAGGSKSFHVVGARGGGGAADTEVVRLDPFDLSRIEDRVGSAQIRAAVGDPVNVAFDSLRDRLLLLDNANRLLEVRSGAGGDLDPGTLARRDALRLDLSTPQGMTVNPASGVVYILDAGTMVRIEPGADGSLDAATTSSIALSGGLADGRGLAFDPSTGHLHVRSGQTLHELTTSGEAVATRDLSGLELATAEGMVFAPSGDLTDDPAQSSLYVADSGSAVSSGQIVELSLAPLPTVAADFTASLVHTIDTAAFSPPSPDPSGLTYLPPPRNTLLMTDGEVEETVSGITHFQGVNVWEFDLDGSPVRDTANVSKIAPTSTPMTNEPVGVTWQPSTGHYFISEDGGKRVYNLNPGGDNSIGTSDDTWTYFSTLANGNNNDDPEGIAYDTAQNHLFVADGVNAEIYEYTTTGTVLNHFDTARFGVADPETVEYNADSDTLFVLSNRQSGPIIIETTRAGALLQTIDVSSAADIKPAGLAYAPASNGTGVKRFYFCDRGIDNNNDPRIVDGKVFEFTAPTSGPPVNNPPFVSAGPDQTVTISGGASLDGTATDDGLPNPPGTLTTTWSKVSGPGTVTFSNPNAVDTTAGFTATGTYVLQLLASDSALSSTDTVTITVNPAGTNSPPSVSAGPDQTIAPSATAVLDGTVTDDGLPNPPGAVTTSWSRQSGPGTVTFGNASAVDTTATFSVPGTYVLRLTGSDGAATAFDELTVTVSAVTLYFALGSAQTLSGVPFTPQDVVAYDGSTFSLLVDGSDVGLDTTGEGIDAFARLPNGHLLVSTKGAFSVPGLSGKDEDVLEFTPTLLGSTTSGTWSMYLNGANVGLEASTEDVDAVGVLGDGRILVSTRDVASVGGIAGDDEDVLAYTPSTGAWELYFDGTDVGLTNSGEDVDGVAVAANGALYLSSAGAFSVTNVAGADEDVFVFTPTSLGSNTAGTFSSTLYLDGSAVGLAGNDVVGLELP